MVPRSISRVTESAVKINMVMVRMLFGALFDPLSAPKADPGHLWQSHWNVCEKPNECGVTVGSRWGSKFGAYSHIGKEVVAHIELMHLEFVTLHLHNPGVLQCHRHRPGRSRRQSFQPAVRTGPELLDDGRM